MPRRRPLSPRWASPSALSRTVYASMSSGCAAIPLLKAAPERGQLAERLEGGRWRGGGLCLAASHVGADEALARAIAETRRAREGRELALTAEAPVTGPSGAFLRVDPLAREAAEGIERSAEFAAAIGSPVLTIRLFCPRSPNEFRSAGLPDEGEVE